MTEQEKTVEKTDDGRHIIVNGRKWRAADPTIPDNLRQQLVNELMDARRLVKTDPETARPRVHDAKVALGERGEPWWDPTDQGQRERLAAAIRALLHRRAGKTICPSEAARIVGGDQWRDLMDTSRDVAKTLVDEGLIVVTQKGQQVDITQVRGPIRLQFAADYTEPSATS